MLSFGLQAVGVIYYRNLTTLWSALVPAQILPADPTYRTVLIGGITHQSENGYRIVFLTICPQLFYPLS